MLGSCSLCRPFSFWLFLCLFPCAYPSPLPSSFLSSCGSLPHSPCVPHLSLCLSLASFSLYSHALYMCLSLSSLGLSHSLPFSPWGCELPSLPFLSASEPLLIWPAPVINPSSLGAAKGTKEGQARFLLEGEQDEEGKAPTPSVLPQTPSSSAICQHSYQTHCEQYMPCVPEEAGQTAG